MCDEVGRLVWIFLYLKVRMFLRLTSELFLIRLVVVVRVFVWGFLIFLVVSVGEIRVVVGYVLQKHQRERQSLLGRDFLRQFFRNRLWLLVVEIRGLAL